MSALMSLALVAFSLSAPPDDGWTFVDAAARDGRLAVTFRTAELSDKPAKPLHKDDVPPAGAQYGVVPLGPAGKHRLGLIWDAQSGAVWLDANGDGRFDRAERHVLGAKPVEVRVPIPFDAARSENRTLLMRKRGDGLAYAVRGYTAGRVMVAGKSIAALLTDGDADGAFDGAGSDRVWLDLDGDGHFDPLTEQFPLGLAINYAATTLLARPRADGLGLSVCERPKESGALRVKLVRLPGAPVVELAVQYVSEYGEMIVIRSEGEAIRVPAGKYRLESVRLKLADADGKVWHYGFASANRSGSDLEVRQGQETVHRLLEDLKASVWLEPEPAVAGGTVQVQPSVTAGRLYLTRCEVGARHVEVGREVPAELRLTKPGSILVDQASAGFV